MSEATESGKAAIKRGDDLAKDIFSLLRKQGVEAETEVVFYCTLIGVQAGNIAGHIGREATLVILEEVKKLISLLLDNPKLK